MCPLERAGTFSTSRWASRSSVLYEVDGVRSQVSGETAFDTIRVFALEDEAQGLLLYASEDFAGDVV